MKLRDYQQQAITDIRKNFARWKNRIILCAPTGAGKTVMFSEITRLTTLKGNKVLIATDRKELTKQAGNKLNDFNIDYSLLTAKTKKIPDTLAVVCMLETLKRRLKLKNYVEFINTFDLIILDEAHKSSFDKLFNSLKPNQKVIGATATPYRTGKMTELNNFYDAIVQTIDIPDLIELGFLSKPINYGIPVDLSKIKTVRGDYDDKQLSNLYDDKQKFGGVIFNYNKYANNKKALVFCVSIDNSKKLCEEFIINGYNAKHLDSNMSDVERNGVLDWYEQSNNGILCNVGILTTGFDSPDTECIILYRATKSLPLFLQMVGRGSRVTSTKSRFIILDFGNNVLNHGFWEDNRTWTLDNAKKKKTNKDEAAPFKECEMPSWSDNTYDEFNNPGCGAMIPLMKKVCPECGFIFPNKPVDELEIILLQLTPSEVQKYAERCEIKELEQIRMIKGYKLGWMCYKLKTLEKFQEYEKIRGFKEGWAEYQYSKFRK